MNEKGGITFGVIMGCIITAGWLWLVDDMPNRIIRGNPLPNTLYTREWKYDEDNPFEKANMDTIRVLEVRDGFISYESIRGDFKSSLRARAWYVFNPKRVN